MKSRESRKLDHIRYAVSLEDGPCATGFSDIRVMHNCLPRVNRDKVSLVTALPGVGPLSNPVILNAITGGAGPVKAINEQLALVGRETGCAMAVGSQYGAVRSQLHDDTFSVVRKLYPKGILFANISALATVDEARRAVAMIEAQGLQIHLNPAQELAMEEGDRDFSRWSEHIAQICQKVEVPVIAKETGCGMAREQAQELLDCGVTLLDIGGAGGTNFPAIEGCRYPEGNRELAEWGIPTAVSLAEVVGVRGWQQGIIASGGIRSALDILKAQLLGANAVGMAGNVLKRVVEDGTEAAITRMKQCLEALKDFYALTGCEQIGQLRQVRYYVTGELAEALRWLSQDEPENISERGI